MDVESSVLIRLSVGLHSSSHHDKAAKVKEILGYRAAKVKKNLRMQCGTCRRPLDTPISAIVFSQEKYIHFFLIVKLYFSGD